MSRVNPLPIDVSSLAILANGANPRIYRPRVRAFLTVPVAGTSSNKRALEDNSDTITLEFRVRKCRIEYNDHNQSDTASIEAEYLDVGQDPRFLYNAVVEIYIDEENIQNDMEIFKTDDSKNLRFVGIATKINRGGSEEEGFTLKMEFHDYTQLFIENKHYPPDKVPTYNMTLSQAWALICDNTGYFNDNLQIQSSVSQLRTNIKFIGDTQDIVLGEAVLPRFRQFGKVQVHPDKDSWAVWQECCLLLGLISFIFLDHVFVTTATNYYSSEDPARLIWGNNILSINEERNSTLVRKGIRIVSFDPLTGSTLEAFYPPIGDKRALKKAITAKAFNKKGPGAVEKAEERFDFYYPAVTNPERLTEIARRVYEEKARQELEGTLVTHEMRVNRKVSNNQADLLALSAGDTIRVEFDPEDRTTLKKQGSRNNQIAYLLERGYTPTVAEYLVDNLQTMDSWVPEFLVKRVTIELDSDEESGNFQVEINYINHIQIDGTTDPGF